MIPSNTRGRTTAAPPFRPPADFPPAGASPADLATAARASMEAEWAGGNPVPPEWYLERAPALAGDPAAALDVIFLEYVLRDEAGEDPSATTFAGRFPALADELRRIIGLDAALARPDHDATFTVTATSAAGTPSIGRYLVVEELGGGGQADVFLGMHPGLGREVVIKRLRAGAGSGADDTARLATEGRVLAGLDHPNLARVYDLDVADGRPFMVMESVRGRNLHEVRKHGPVAPADAARWVAALARAAEHAHGRGVLHLDIKPRNVVLDDSGRPVLLDFGLARVDRGLDPPGPEAGVSGTPAYMAPEQARGEHDRIGPPADVYGLGGVLYYLLTGSNPTRGATTSEVFTKAERGEWDRESLRACGAPPRLVRVCERALDPDPAKRFPSAAAMADALERAVRRRWWPAAAVGAIAAALLVSVAVAAWPPGAAPINPTAPPAVDSPLKKPDLRFTLGVYREDRFHTDLAAPFSIGEQLRITADIPANRHATLIMVTEAGELTPLAHAGPQATAHPFTYPASPDPGNPETKAFTEPTGTHVFLLAVAASGRVTPEQLGLKSGERWPRLPYLSVVLVADGRARVRPVDPQRAALLHALQGSTRPVGPGGSVADPEGEVVARLERVLREAPADVTVEGVAFAVKPR